MTASELYTQFGGRIAFHGGIDVQQLLPRGTPGKAREETIRVKTEFDGLNGGTIIAPSHTVQADTPPENIVAMAEAVAVHTDAERVD